MGKKQYIKLPQISNQKIRQKYYTPESISHPAKANIPMMIWILKKFVQDEDIVLDLMCGIGTTIIEGMRLFPNSLFIGVELEDKFVKMGRANIRKVERIAKKDMFLKIGKAVCLQGDAKELSQIMKKEVNKIVTSPPYSQKTEPFSSKSYLRIRKEIGRNTNQPSQKYIPYSQNQDNIGNLKHGKIDKVITSPPYEEAMGKKHHSPANAKLTWEKKLPNIYTDNKNNIGNLKGKTYLGEMLRVYKQCYKVLRPAGLMILITKDFIRNKKRVRLGEDTIKLSEAAGFTFKEIYYRKIEHPSFWRINYQQKHPEVEKIDNEDILVFGKEEK